MYQILSTDNLSLLASIYHENVSFTDPIHQVQGFKNLQEYFQSMYKNLSECRFVINEVIVNKSEAAIYWDMTYIHPQLNKGKAVTVSGTSKIKEQDNKIIYHRDYLDVGAMLYEQLPIIGKLITWIKAKAAS